MTKPKRDTKPKNDSEKKSRTLQLRAEPGKAQEAQLAEFTTRGIVPMASVLTTYSRDTYSEEVSLTDAYGELMRLSDAAAAGDLTQLERLLSAQALALNSVFAGLAHRAKTNSQGGYLGAADTYLRLALRAQAQCRQTVQTLFEMKNPRPVAFVQQANISNGPQQVNNGPGLALPRNTRAGAHAEKNDPAPSKLLEAQDGERLDLGAQGSAGRASQELAPVGPLNGTEDRCG